MNPFAIFMRLTTAGGRAVELIRTLGAFMAAHRGQLRAGLITLLICAALSLIILYLRTLGLSKALRRYKETHFVLKGNRGQMRRMKLKSLIGTLIRMLIPLALGLVLVCLVYPRRSSDMVPFVQGAYDRLADRVVGKRLLLGTLWALLIPAVALWIFAISRRVKSRGGRVFWMLIVLACLGIFGRGAYLEMKNSRAVTVPEASADEMFILANGRMDKGEYATAEELYSTLFARGEYTSVTDADMLNNLALAQLKQAKHTEALNTMQRVFETGHAGSRHVINLLAAAQANNIPSGTIIDQVGAGSLINASMVKDKKPGEYVKLRNAIAYNIAYMDMELDESGLSDGYPFGELFPEASLPGVSASGWASEAARDEATETALRQMQSDNKSAYGKADGDIEALTRYFQALTAQER